jgi:hypothetical protein
MSLFSPQDGPIFREWCKYLDERPWLKKLWEEADLRDMERNLMYLKKMKRFDQDKSLKGNKIIFNKFEAAK